MSKFNVVINGSHNRGDSEMNAPFIKLSVKLKESFILSEKITIETLIELVGYEGAASLLLDLINNSLNEQGYEILENSVLCGENSLLEILIKVLKNEIGSFGSKFSLKETVVV